MTTFEGQPLVEVIRWMTAELAAGRTEIELAVLDPDSGRGLYAGELVGTRVHRPYRVWLDLAERLGLRMLTPRSEPPLVVLRFERLDAAARLRPSGEATERYGADSPFARIAKHEDPGFVIDLADALERCRLGRAARILDLGVNTGDEVALLRALGVTGRVVGVDHSESAIGVARRRFPNDEFHVADLATLPSLSLGRFDLVLSIGTLQSPGVDDRDIVRRIVQDHLAPGGSVIIGMPNCRYIDGEIEYGTRVKNFRQPELGVLVKDLAFYRKYLQQHKLQVFVTGKHYVLVTAVSSASGAAPAPAAD